VQPFRIEVPDDELSDLRRRLDATRWPDQETVDDWSQGVPLSYLQTLCRYWAHEYDWRAREARLNALPQLRTTIDGLGVHFVHVRSPNPDALPLILTHGWPGSFVEFVKVIELLAGEFHVVCPSLPGYGFSDKPTRPGWNVQRIARAWAELMARLGYDRYGAAGSDWGTSVSTSIGLQDPDHVAGIHLVPPLAPPDPATFDDLTAAERAALAELEERARTGDGYSVQQATRPQTLGYGLTDSPAALCAWLVEKFALWADPRSIIDRDELLDNVMLYWITGTGTSSARLYWESIAEIKRLFTEPTVQPVHVPTGCSVFPREVPRISRRWAARRFPDIRYWSEPAVGGHFAALEQPSLFVDDIRGVLPASTVITWR
jgi:pimeloyl-ACP methyl ester carboxylesterase